MIMGEMQTVPMTLTTAFFVCGGINSIIGLAKINF
jgi:hypothetical protein